MSNQVNIGIAAETLNHAVILADRQEKPIMVDYYRDSINHEKAHFAKTETGENILYKNDEEFTSGLKKILKVKDDIICVSENSIYIVHGTIMNK